MRNWFVFYLFCFGTVVLAQNKELSLLKLNQISCKKADQFIGYDSLGFYYTIYQNTLRKTKEHQFLEYKNISLGKITKIDIQNPLRIVVFYQAFNTVVLLDNQLNEIQKINFSENATPLNVTATGIAAQDQLWFYDSLSQQIGLYDYLNGSSQFISTPLSENINSYGSNFTDFYWMDSHSWNSCNRYGKIVSKAKPSSFEQLVFVSDKEYLMAKNSVISIENLEKNTSYQLDIQEKTFKNFSYKDQILSIFTVEGITNYKITLP